MINNIADLVKGVKKDTLYLIVRIENFDKHYMFHLYNFETSSVDSWFEPFSQELSPNYWQTLA